MRRRLYLYLYCLWLIGLSSCASSNQQNRTVNVPAGVKESSSYTSSFPSKDVSRQLSQIQKSVQRITSTVFYNTYFFDSGNITMQDIQEAANTEALASGKSTIDHSKAGTAISILQNGRFTTLVTAQHVLSFPDTIVVYREEKNIPKGTYVESIGVKKSQRSFLISDSEILSIDLLAEDPLRDIALIKVDRSENSSHAPPLPISTGKAQDMRLGSFLYVLGFPLGSPMITRGIVSAPNYDTRGSFLTDALFNKGISGGLIIASRNNFRSFEWVGMAVTASASEHRFLVPDPSRSEEYETMQAYTDTAYISQQRIINYGVTQATPIEQILEFLFRNEDELQKLGLSVTDLNG